MDNPAIAAMQDVVEKVAATPCLVVPAEPEGYNIYWRKPGVHIRVLVHPTGAFDLFVDVPAQSAKKISYQNIPLEGMIQLLQEDKNESV
jgi:hypothetical protein